MDYSFTPMEDQHREAVTAVLDHHIDIGFAAYPSQPLPPQFWDYMRQMTQGHPAYVVEKNGEVVGFGLLRPHQPPDTFRRTAWDRDFDLIWYQKFI